MQQNIADDKKEEEDKEAPQFDMDASSSGVPSQPSSPSQRARPCIFFQRGRCNRGDACSFLHEAQQSAGGAGRAGAGVLSYPPPPVIIDIPPGSATIFSIDVECIATGPQHNARAVAQIALVDEWCRPICNLYVKPDLPIVSYLTPLTGLTKEIIDQYGLPLADALVTLRSLLPPNALLVGQNIKKDVDWLQLVEGLDFASMIDLAGLFRVWNPERNSFTGFSQDHTAKVWLRMSDRVQHNAVDDACISVSLFNAYRSVQWDINRLQQLQAAMMSTERTPSFSQITPSIDGCCLGNRNTCTCGLPPFTYS